jgi:hypothetical protein
MLKLPPPFWALAYTLIAIGASYLMRWPRVTGLPLVWLGVVLVVLGIGLSVTAAMLFRREGTEINPTSPTNRKLVTSGPFGLTRNPMYLGLVLQRSPGSRARSVHTCQGLRPRQVGRALALAHPSLPWESASGLARGRCSLLQSPSSPPQIGCIFRSRRRKCVASSVRRSTPTPARPGGGFERGALARRFKARASGVFGTRWSSSRGTSCWSYESRTAISLKLRHGESRDRETRQWPRRAVIENRLIGSPTIIGGMSLPSNTALFLTSTAVSGVSSCPRCFRPGERR